MADGVEKSVEDLTERVKNSIRPPAMLLQSAGSGLAKGYAEAAECSTRFVHENMVELSRCTQEMLTTRNPLGIAACYGNFLLRWGQRGAEQSAEIGRIMVRAGTSVMTAQADGSRPPVAHGGSDGQPKEASSGAG